MNITVRQTDILKLITSLDISPTMYENAQKKYKSIATYLENHHDLHADMYPQGSFALGTVVRPAVKDDNASYDLDFICQVEGTRDDMTAAELRKSIEEILKSSDLYGGKLEIYDNCITINYADVNGIGFSIDVVPATSENDQNKMRLRTKSQTPQLIDTAIAIPKHNHKNYTWLTNNPRGYREWFETINEPFNSFSSESYRQIILEQNRSIYASVEDIPNGLNRSALQRVIQILKYHRDVFYSKYKNGDDIKPISAIINTVVAKITENARPNISVFDLLKFVLDEFAIYANHQTLTSETFTLRYGQRNVFQRENGTWKIENPANPEDNLADQWNDNPEIPEKFFLWVKATKSDLIDALSLNDAEFRAITESAFGSKIVSNNWGHKYNKISPKPIIASSSPKPWRS
ncbi:nucleotidyltransferase [Robinsoniella peoriensis]|uniref:nucleotidyltransferase domain-containing protein n=1 Tax=Robinsoniella peoriensis TaxID=180332 RepID=UPI0037531B78